ncbi:hypothetical protein C8Q77DRAFT_1068609 [Trametes polyzona]|nr:hypothetical protein C8Q77DRAFT_1068575 [Trametes polyzona]KAI0628147.1 hypothetical protein C8Q77DRAFT_1068592 [Trametes polyzona]KAI0628152.1 hypothetical protein C8Q77DRAFT_1068562 [Trametes polyzona]KAI0628156.1 hypothetical protein C8Q77DRAFT_1068609 [Trametes polyzona]
MLPKCPICSSVLNNVETELRPVVLRDCGHVLCFACFHAVIKNKPGICPFRCGADSAQSGRERPLRAQDGRIVTLSFKEADPQRDTRAAIDKRRAELGRARMGVRKRFKELSGDVAHLKVLVRNQEGIIDGRFKYIARQRATVDRLRAQVALKQQVLDDAHRRLDALRARGQNSTEAPDVSLVYVACAPARRIDVHTRC